MRLLYYLLLKPLSRLPLPVLHRLADLVYLVVYRLIGYRREVVLNNLRNSFPDLPEKDINRIAAGFYAYLADLIMETVWCFSLSEKRLRRHLKVKNPELLDRFFDQEKDVALVLGHYGSWEMVLSGLNRFVRHQVATIYIPLTNAVLDRYFYRMRVQFGSEMIAKKHFATNMAAGGDKPRAIIFGADQSPSISKNIYWTTFLNQDTAVAMGVEKYARKYDMPVVFAWLHQRKRGYYEVEFELVTATPRSEPPGSISEKHVRLMEKQILQRPELWMWSHKRWKKKRPGPGAGPKTE